MNHPNRPDKSCLSRNSFASIAAACSLLLVLSTPTAFAAGTDTWVGNTDANWNTAANWTTDVGSTPPANGDSLVFGVAGTAGTALTNNISGLSVNNFDFISGASAFTMSGNGLTLNGTLTDNASVNETFGGIAIGAGVGAAIKNLGSGTLALGAVSHGSGGTVDFTLTGPITTTTANVNGILGGWATTNNSVSSATVGGWAANDGSGNIIPYAGYTAGVPSGVNNANNYLGGNANITANTTVNSFVYDGSGDITINNGVTLTLSSGGLFIGGTQRWLKTGGSTSTIKSGLATGELYLHCNNGTFTDFQIQPVIADGLVATKLIKDGPGVMKLQGYTGSGTAGGYNKTYTGGTLVSGGTLQLSRSGTGDNGQGVIRGALTVNSNAVVSCITGNTLGWASGSRLETANIIGGLLQTTASGDQGWNVTYNLTGGELRSNGGTSGSGAASYFVLGKDSGGACGVNSLASASSSVVSGRLLLRADNGNSSVVFDVANGAADVDLLVSAAITQSGTSGITKNNNGTMILSGANTYTGATTVNGGTLQMNSANATTPSVTVNTGATLALNVGDALGFTTAKDVPTINSGGTITNIMSAGRVTLWNGLTMTGGALTGASTPGDVNGEYSLSGTVTATSDAGGIPATISGTPISLQNQNVANGTITFNVTRGSATPASDLNVSANLVPNSNAANIGIAKSGTGIMTLSGANTYTGNTTISAGTLLVSGSLGSGFYSGNITNSGSLIYSNAAAQTFGGVISGTGSLIKQESGTLTLSAANTYTGNTVISGGTLALDSSASLASSNVIIASGAILDVSAQGTPALSANQNVLGAGAVNGSLTTAAGSKIYPGTDGVAGTLTFNNDLTMTAGSAFNVDVSTSASSGNDAVSVVAGTLTLNNTAFNVRALGGAANLATSADYVLVTAASISGSPNPVVTWIGTQPGNAGNFTVVAVNNTVVLHFTPATPPHITSAVANPTTLLRGQTTLLTAGVTAGSNPLGSVTVSGSALTGTVTLVAAGGGNYTNTATISPSAALGSQTLTFTAADTLSLSSQSNITVTVVAANEVWNGAGSDNNWSTVANWASGAAPGVGDYVVFAGATQTTPNLDAAFNVAALTFSNGAASFTITNEANTLTLTGGVTNNSANLQTVNVPVNLNTAQPITAAAGELAFGQDIANNGNVVTVAGNSNTTASAAISGTGGLTKSGNGTLTLSGTNTYSGATTISGGVLKVDGAGQLGSGNYSGVITNNGTLNLNSSAGQTLSGVISGAGALTKSGTGALSLSVANTYGGGTIVSNGTLTLGDGTALGSGTLTLAGGTLNNSANIGVGNNTAVNGTATIYAKNGSGDWTFSGALTGSGTLADNVANQNQSLNINGDLSGFTGTLQYDDSNNTYNNLNIGGGAAGSMNASQAKFVLSGGANLARALRISGAGGAIFQLGDLSGAGGTLGFNSAITLAVGSLNSNSVFAGTIVNSGGLTKVGTGTLTLSGANSYTGATTVSNGTLLVNGSLAAGSAVAVNGGMLGGTGTIGGAVTVNSGGTLAPGSGGIGALTVSGNITLNAGSTNTFAVDGTTPANVAVTAGASVTYGGMLKIVSTGTFTAGQNFTLFSGAGAASASNFSSIQGSPGSGLGFTFTNGVLSVVTAGSSGPATITNSFSGGVLSLSWPAGQGWRLQIQTNSLTTGLGTNWNYITDGSASSTNITVDPAKPTVFYRLVNP